MKLLTILTFIALLQRNCVDITEDFTEQQCRSYLGLARYAQPLFQYDKHLNFASGPGESPTFLFSHDLHLDAHQVLYYFFKHVKGRYLDSPIHISSRSHILILLLISGIEPNPGPRPPRYPCGVCKLAVRDVGQRALACDECDTWCHKSCLQMNTLDFDNLAESDTPWYCPTCNSLNRSMVVYDLPEPVSDHSSVNASGIINSTRSTATVGSDCLPASSHTVEDISDTTLSSIGSPVIASSPKAQTVVKRNRNSCALRFLCINFQSIRKKGKYISTLIESTRPDVIIGTETWLSSDVNSSEIFEENLGFDVHRSDRPNSPHGGVLLAVKRELNVADVRCSDSVELITGCIKTKSKKRIVIGSYYRPPSRTDETYLENTRSELLNIKAKNKRSIFVLGGDFNLPDICWNDNSIRPNKQYPGKVSQHFLDLTADMGLEQVVDFPTRGDNILDLVLTSHPGYKERCKPLPPITAKSDHDIVLFDLSLQPVRTRPKRRTIYLWKKANIQGIKQAFSGYGSSFMNTTFHSVNDMWLDIKNTIDKVVQEFVPTRRTLARTTHPWIDSSLRKLTKRKNRAFRKAKHSGRPADWARYNKLKATSQRRIRQSHRQYMTDIVSNSYKDSPKQFWSYIKSKKQESFGVAPLKNKDGFIHSDSKSKAEILNDQFCSVFTEENMSCMPDKGPSPHPTMDRIIIQTKGVFKQLAGLNPHKATGPDCIPTAILRIGAEELAPIFTRLYQTSLDSGEVPIDWRDAQIVPVFKKGEKHLPSNYRPVSLTSIVCKVMEHIIYSSVMCFFDQHSILTNAQHGFRAKRSCETQLLWTIETIAKRLQGKGQVDVVLLDFAKAFDKVPHNRLLYKLQFYGVRGNTLKWIQGFLTNRKQRVVLDGERSTEADVLSGVPQGTVLGPLLFLTYINDLPESVTSSSTRLFADDSLLFRYIKNQQDADLLQKDLTALEKWESDWQMKFHPEKCTVLRISTNRRHKIQTTYKLHGHTLATADSSKYLGVTISDDLSWKKHVHNTAAKGHKVLGFVRRNLADCTEQIKVAAYTTIIRPTLEYASTVWDPKTRADIHSLEQVQRKSARFVKNQYTDRTPGCVTEMVNSLGWEPLHHRRYIARLSMLFKINNNIVVVPESPLQQGDQRTRGSCRFAQLQTSTNTYRESFFPCTIRDWNSLPTRITDSQSYEGFRAAVRSLPVRQ